MQYVKPEVISLKNSSEFNEQWVQNRIAEDPSILGLGDLFLLDKERRQRHGRLDFLLQDPDDGDWYEVEVQLGQTDESHIIRTIEYWDEERRRYKQIKHTAVIVAEEITNRFYNVINLFNGAIPLIAIQLQAVKIGEAISLIATKVLDKIELVPDDDTAEDVEIGRSYWVDRSSEESVELADEMLRRARQCDSSLEIKYNKHYIGLAKNEMGFNFVSISPTKKHAWLNVKMPASSAIDERIQTAGLDYRYDKGFRNYVIRVTEKIFETNTSLLDDLIQSAYKRRME